MSSLFPFFQMLQGLFQRGYGMSLLGNVLSTPQGQRQATLAWTCVTSISTMTSKKCSSTLEGDILMLKSSGVANWVGNMASCSIALSHRALVRAIHSLTRSQTVLTRRTWKYLWRTFRVMHCLTIFQCGNTKPSQSLFGPKRLRIQLSWGKNSRHTHRPLTSGREGLKTIDSFLVKKKSKCWNSQHAKVSCGSFF